MMNEWILSSSLLIAAVLLGRRLLRGKISLRLQYALWGLVLLRLLLPVQLFTSDYGVGTVAQEVDISAPVREVYLSAYEDRYELAYDEAYRWAAEAYAAQGQTVDPVVIEKTAQDMAQADLELDLKGLLTRIWLGGMAVMSAVILFCNIHLSRRLRFRRWEYPATESLLPVYVTQVLPTPCIFGLFQPVIYLTPEAAKDEQVRCHVLAHEQTHYRHCDHIWSVLRSVCLVLHWYNPLVWIAVKTSKTDAELACDEGVLARLGERHRGDYGRTLIGLTCASPMGDFLLTATTMTGSAGSIRQRIKLLMARPRNTIVTLTAVILIGTLVVGCSFAGAPEITEPTAMEPSATLPEEDLLGLIDGNGLLVYPGTRWNMTKAEVMAVLGLAELPATSMDSGFTIENHTFLGQDAEISFFFWQYRPETEWGLSSVTVTFADEDGANEVIQKITEALGKPDHAGNGLDFRFWYSDANVEDLLSPEAYQLWQEAMSPPAGTLIDSLSGRTASFLHWLGARSPADNPKSTLSFEGNITPGLQIEEVLRGENQTNRFDDPVEEVRSLLGENGDADNLAALTRLWSGYGGIRESQFVDPFIPNIVDCVQADEDTIYVYYNRPGSAQLYQAEMAPHADSWAVVDNVMVLAMADYADRNLRELKKKELREFQTEFNVLMGGNINSAACFLATCYADISEMDGGEFLAYFPGSTEATPEEFDLLKQKYPDVFGGWNRDDLPVPIHCYSAKEIDAVITRYTNIHWAELDEGVLYLEETGCYYNYTSDFGLGVFDAKGGWVYDGGAVVYSDFSALFFTEVQGQYRIQAHLPAIVLGLPSSQPMIPADTAPEDAVRDVLDAFFLAHQENSYLYTDHNYDGLTVLSADPDRTVTFEGKTVPLSDFFGNIEYLHDKEAYWKHVRQSQGISRTDFSTSCRISTIDFDGDIAYALVGSGVTFTYTDAPNGGPSGMSSDYEVLLIQVDGSWLIADVLELQDWFDAENKNNPDFDVDQMIADYIPS